MNPEPAQPETERDAGVVIAVLMPHAPVLVPALGDKRLSEAASTVRAMREAARRVVAAEPQSLVAVSPHSPRQRGAFGFWTGQTLRGSLGQFGAPQASVSVPIDRALSAVIITEAKSRGVKATKDPLVSDTAWRCCLPNSDRGLAFWVTEAQSKARYVEAFQRPDFEAMLNYYKPPDAVDPAGDGGEDVNATGTK